MPYILVNFLRRTTRFVCTILQFFKWYALMSRVSYKFIINAIIITAPLLVLTGIILFPAIYNASLFL